MTTDYKIISNDLQKNMGKLIFAIVLFLAFITSKNYISYFEIDSYALPVISLQYRHTVWMDERDLEIARRDFPTLYSGIYTYDDLRSAKLKIGTNGEWESYYFPVYAMLVLPIKLILQLFHLDQEYCFYITNFLLVLYLLNAILESDKLKADSKYMICLLLLISPLFLYIPFISSECMMFCAVGLSTLRFYEKKYRRGALIISIASLANVTAVMMGVPFILEYLIEVLKELYKNRNFDVLKKKIVDTVIYAICFLPCFIQFIISAISGAGHFSVLSGEVVARYGAYANTYVSRIFTYIFDLNLGLFSFAIATMVLFAIVTILLLIKRQFRVLYFWLAMILVIASYSLMPHINSGMWYCARYVFWTYPIIAVSFGIYLWDVTQKEVISFVGALCAIVVTGLFIVGNSKTYRNYNTLNQFSRYVLDMTPGLYSTNFSTFNCRVTGSEGGYNIPDFVMYEDSDENAIRKIAIIGNEDAKSQIKDILGESISDKLNKIPNDDLYHYININRWEKQQYYYTDEYTLKQLGIEGDYELSLISEFNDIVISDNRLQVLPIHLESNKIYKIEMNINKEQSTLDNNGSDFAWIDFYGENYDFPSQEKRNFLKDNVFDYTFYIGSDEITNPNDMQNLRIFMPGSKTIVLDKINVYEVVQ